MNCQKILASYLKISLIKITNVRFVHCNGVTIFLKKIEVINILDNYCIGENKLQEIMIKKNSKIEKIDFGYKINYLVIFNSKIINFDITLRLFILFYYYI